MKNKFLLNAPSRLEILWYVIVLILGIYLGIRFGLGG